MKKVVLDFGDLDKNLSLSEKEELSEKIKHLTSKWDCCYYADDDLVNDFIYTQSIDNLFSITYNYHINDFDFIIFITDDKDDIKEYLYYKQCKIENVPIRIIKQ